VPHASSAEGLEAFYTTIEINLEKICNVTFGKQS